MDRRDPVTHPMKGDRATSRNGWMWEVTGVDGMGADGRRWVYLKRVKDGQRRAATFGEWTRMGSHERGLVDDDTMERLYRWYRRLKTERLLANPHCDLPYWGVLARSEADIKRSLEVVWSAT